MRRHDLDPVSLVAGVLFAVVAVMSLLDHADLVSVNGRWVWPLLLIGLGLVGLLTSLRGDGPDVAADEATSNAPETPAIETTEPAPKGGRRATRR